MPFDASYQTIQPTQFTPIAGPQDIALKASALKTAGANQDYLAAETAAKRQDVQSGALDLELKRQQVTDSHWYMDQIAGVTSPTRPPVAPIAGSGPQGTNPTTGAPTIMQGSGATDMTPATQPGQQPAAAPATGQPAAPPVPAQPAAATPPVRRDPLAILDQGLATGQIHMPFYQAQKKVLQEFAKNDADVQEKRASAAKATQEVTDTEDGHLADMAKGLQQTKNPADPTGKQYDPSVVNSTLEIWKQFYGPTNPALVQKIDGLRNYLNQNPNQTNQVIDRLAELGTAAQKTAAARKLTADTGATSAGIKAPGEQAQADQLVRTDAASKLAAAAAQGPAAVSAVMGQLPYNVAKQFEGAQKPEDFLKIGQTPNEQVTTAETKKRDDAAAADATKRIGIAQAGQNLRQQTFNVTMQNSKQQGLLGVPPHLVTAASGAFEKAGIEYAAASSAADTMQSMLDLAEKGNKAAGSNVALVGVETLNAINGIKRINGAEIAQYGSAGSLLDKVKGEIGKLALGKPIDQSVLDDIRELHTEIAKQASTTYARKVQVTNQTYGSQFTPVQFGAAAPKAPPATGAIQDGYMFLGGDPSDPKRWKQNGK